MPSSDSPHRRHGSIDPKKLRDLDDEAPAEEAEESGAAGWTKHELMTVGELSGKGFDTLRKAARVKGPTHGGLRHVFSVEDMFALIQKAESGKYNINGGPAAKAWRALLADAGIAMPAVISRARR